MCLLGPATWYVANLRGQTTMTDKANEAGKPLSRQRSRETCRW